VPVSQDHVASQVLHNELFSSSYWIMYAFKWHCTKCWTFMAYSVLMVFAQIALSMHNIACATMVDSELWQIRIETVLLVFIARRKELSCRKNSQSNLSETMLTGTVRSLHTSWCSLIYVQKYITIFSVNVGEKVSVFSAQKKSRKLKINVYRYNTCICHFKQKVQ